MDKFRGWFATQLELQVLQKEDAEWADFFIEPRPKGQPEETPINDYGVADRMQASGRPRSASDGEKTREGAKSKEDSRVTA
jgi:hypothetical protein